MPDELRIITLPLTIAGFKLTEVNCYLIKTGPGYILIDTGPADQRTALERELISAGCQPGTLKLIVLTHGDFDHTSNAAYLHERYRAPLALHHADTGMVERGDMFWNRQKGNPLLRWVAPRMFGFDESARFTPDCYLEDGCSLSGYVFDATVLHIPGHSAGSIGLLTSNGDFFCGDLFTNTERPVLNSIMDDLTAGQASVEKLKRFEIKTLYPGHGRPFSIDQIH